MFDIESLKETLGDETFSELKTHIDDLTGQRDQARNESISGRKTLKAKLEAYETQVPALLEKLGIDSFDDLDDLPDDKGAAEAVKQFETKLKRMERQVTEAVQARDELDKKYRNSRRSSVVSEALAAHEFVAPDVVSTFISDRLVWEDDDLLFKNDDGGLVSVRDGVAGFAKLRPELLKSKGAGGADYRSKNAGGESGQTTMTRADFEALPPAKQMEVAKAGVTLQ